MWVSESSSSHSSSLLQDLGYVVLSLHVMVQGKVYCVILGHVGVQGSTCPKRVASPYILQRSRSLQLIIPSHSSIQFPASPMNLWLVRQVPHCCHQLSLYTLFSCMASSFSSRPQGGIPHTRPLDLFPYYPRPHGRVCFFLTTPMEETLLFQPPPPLFLNARPGTSYVTSYSAPPMMCYFCQFPHIYYLLLAAIFS